MKKLVPILSSYIDAGPEAQRLTDKPIPCDGVKLSVWATNDNATKSLKPEIEDAAVSTAGTDIGPVQGTEIYWGFLEVCVHPLYPAQSEPLIPIQSSDEIFVACHPNQTTIRIGYTLFRAVDDQEKHDV